MATKLSFNNGQVKTKPDVSDEETRKQTDRPVGIKTAIARPSLKPEA